MTEPAWWEWIPFGDGLAYAEGPWHQDSARAALVTNHGAQGWRVQLRSARTRTWRHVPTSFDSEADAKAHADEWLTGTPNLDEPDVPRLHPQPGGDDDYNPDQVVDT